MSLTDWNNVADSLAADLPSPALRRMTAVMLSKVELLGPLLNEQRTPADEFRRVYKFLTYNEPSRVMAVVDDRLAAFKRQGSNPLVKHNAWNYVVGAFDLWLSRARVFYTATGLIEGALRARLDARLSDTFGPDWPQSEDAVPSSVREIVAQGGALNLIGAVRRLLEDATPDQGKASKTLVTLRELIVTEPAATKDGATFVGELEFGQLRSFFQTKRLWNKGPKLATLFRDPSTGGPPLRGAIMEVLGVIHDVRNDVAHYKRPASPCESEGHPAEAPQPPSFTKGLYALAKLARWMGVDLQHFYGSVDTRNSTELSILIEDRTLLARTIKNVTGCAGDACVVGQPFDVMLRSAPTEAAELVVEGNLLACLFHRVQLRVLLHRPQGE